MGLFSFLSKKVSKYEKFMCDCETVVASYENETSPSCKDDLMEAIKTMTEGAKNEINSGGIPTSQHFILINKLIANASFDLLVSGKYHLYRGTLNPMSCSQNLMIVHDKSIDYGYKNGLVTKAEKDEDHECLMEYISRVG